MNSVRAYGKKTGGRRRRLSDGRGRPSSSLASTRRTARPPPSKNTMKQISIANNSQKVRSYFIMTKGEAEGGERQIVELDFDMKKRFVVPECSWSLRQSSTSSQSTLNCNLM